MHEAIKGCFLEFCVILNGQFASTYEQKPAEIPANIICDFMFPSSLFED
jgi:hypothetical protein